MQGSKFRKVLFEKFVTPDEVLVSSDGLIYRWVDSVGERTKEMYENGLCYYYRNGLLIKSENRGKIEDQIAEIMQEFDFGKVHSVCEFLRMPNNESVTPIHILKDKAESLLWRTYEECERENGEELYIETGGFRATYWRDLGLKLEFNVDSWDTMP